MIFDPEGELLAKKKIEYDPLFSSNPGWAEQHAEIYWDALCRACKELKSEVPEYFSKIAGVGITSLRACAVCLDREGKPLRPIILWLDQRKARPVYQPGGLMKFVYRAIGMNDTLSKIQKEAKCNWIIQNQPDIWKATHKYLLVSGFLNFRLTGKYRDSIASQQGHIPFDYKRLSWAKKRHLFCGLFPIDRELLPDLVTPGEMIGEVTDKAARSTGIDEGIPVIACGSDKGSETIGMGVLSEKMASLSFGTTATIQTTSNRYFEPLRFMPPYAATIPGYYNAEVEIFRGYWMITWFKNEFGHKEVAEAKLRGIAPEEILNGLLKQTPPGSMGLVCQPFWRPGLKQTSAKGSLIGFGDIHTRAHVYRSVIEGLGFALYQGLGKIEKASGQKVKKIAVSGGASQSDEICQISADIFNLPMIRGRTFEASGLGAAIVTSVGIGIHRSFKAAIEKMVAYDTVFYPTPENTELYQCLYNRVYKKLFPTIKNLCKEIRTITCYPD